MATRGHILDANTLALWRLDETVVSPLIDATGKYPFSASGETNHAGLIADGGAAKFFTPASFPELHATADAAATTAMTGPTWTVEAWVQLDSSFASTAGVLIHQVGGLFSMDLQINADRKFLINWHTAGTDALLISPSPLAVATTLHIAARKNSATTADLFLNGVKIASGSGFLPCNVVGTGEFALGGAGVGYFNGTIDDTRVSRVARTDAEILDSYRRGITDADMPSPVGVPFQELSSTDYQVYQKALSPTALLDPTGTLFEAAFAAQKDYFADRVRLSIKSKLPALAPTDALAQLGLDRQLDRGASESDAAYALRLQRALDTWAFAGTPYGLLLALYNLGYTNALLLTSKGMQYQLAPGAAQLVATNLDGGTNLLLYSQEFDNGTAWPKLATATVTPNATIAPDGTLTGSLINGGSTPGGSTDIEQAYDATEASALIVSIWLKLGPTGVGAADAVWLYNQTAAVAYTIPYSSLTNSWQRFSIVTAVASGDHVRLQLYPNGAAGGGTNRSFYAWGAQLEKLSVATPYTPTSGTRARGSRDFWDIDANRLPSDAAAWAANTVFGPNGHVVPSVVTWAPNTLLAAGQVVRPLAKQTGFLYQNLGAAGTTGSTEPTWPSGGTVADGGITWTTSVRPGTFFTTADGLDWSEFSWGGGTWNGGAPSGAVQPTWPTTIGGTVVDRVNWGGFNWGPSYWSPVLTWANSGLDFFSRFDVLFPGPLASGETSNTSDEANRIRAVIKAWRPAHATNNRITIITGGKVFGGPQAPVWADFNWTAAPLFNGFNWGAQNYASNGAYYSSSTGVQSYAAAGLTWGNSTTVNWTGG